jgi:hypothetical protein
MINVNEAPGLVCRDLTWHQSLFFMRITRGRLNLKINIATLHNSPESEYHTNVVNSYPHLIKLMNWQTLLYSQNKHLLHKNKEVKYSIFGYEIGIPKYKTHFNYWLDTNVLSIFCSGLVLIYLAIKANVRTLVCIIKNIKRFFLWKLGEMLQILHSHLTIYKTNRFAMIFLHVWI